MVETLKEYPKCPHPISKGTVAIVTVTLMPHKVILAEVGVKSNAIHIETIAKK